MATNNDVCKCKSRRGASGLYYAPVDKLTSCVVWVCAECLLPMRSWYEKFIVRCEDCLDEFSTPWSEVCYKCHRIAHSDVKVVEGAWRTVARADMPAYRGWGWGMAQEVEGRHSARQKWLRRGVDDSPGQGAETSNL